MSVAILVVIVVACESLGRVGVSLCGGVVYAKRASAVLFCVCAAASAAAAVSAGAPLLLSPILFAVLLCAGI